MAKQQTSTSRSGAKKPGREQTMTHYNFPLTRINFIIIAAAVLAIIIGFALMAGGGSDDGEYNPEIFSTTRIVIGPAIAFLAFIAVGVGIMWKNKKQYPDQQ